MRMRHLLIVLVVLCTALPVIPLASEADSGNGRGIIVKRDAAEQFAVLPAGVRFPEGIAANPKNGDVFVGTFDPNGDPQHPNKLLRFDRRGKLQASKDFGAMPLLGLEFNERLHQRSDFRILREGLEGFLRHVDPCLAFGETANIELDHQTILVRGSHLALKRIAVGQSVFASAAGSR